MKHHLLITILLAGLFACQPQPSITDQEVKEVLNGFFDALDVAQRDSVSLDDYVTDDFIIYENQKVLDKEEFKAFIDKASGGVLESSWKLSDYRISIDQNSAHASFYNVGTFLIQGDSTTFEATAEWLESAYLVKEDNGLQIKFYFSDRMEDEK